MGGHFSRIFPKVPHKAQFSVQMVKQTSVSRLSTIGCWLCHNWRYCSLEFFWIWLRCFPGLMSSYRKIIVISKQGQWIPTASTVGIWVSPLLALVFINLKLVNKAKHLELEIRSKKRMFISQMLVSLYPANKKNYFLNGFDQANVWKSHSGNILKRLRCLLSDNL